MDKLRSVSAQEVMALRRVTGIGVMDAKRFLENANDTLYRRILEALTTQPEGNRLFDLTEEKPQFTLAFQQANEMTHEELKDAPGRMGLCHRYWNTKKRILREQFGIEWFTPAEMNPGIFFD